MTKIFVLTAVDFDLIADQRPDENAQDVLWSGQVFRTEAAAKANAQAFADEEAQACDEPSSQLAWEWLDADPDFKPEEGEATYVGYWTCEGHEYGRAFVIRVFELEG